MSSEAGPSEKHMSIEEQARQKNISFWELNPQMEDAEAAELARDGDGDFVLESAEATTTDGEPTSTDVGGGDHTDGGGDHTDGTNLPAKRPAKKPRKDRTPQAVGNVTDTFTKVSVSGQPQEPRDIAKGYDMQLGCILRETASINTYDLRNPENEALRNDLLKKVHKRYIFPADESKKVDNFAITKMNTALTSWRALVGN